MTSRSASGAVSAALVAALAMSMWTAIRAADDPGEHLYERHCRRCHGEEGRGTRQAPSLVPFRWTYDEALELIRHPMCDMPPVPESAVSDAEVAQIVAYLKRVK